MACRNVALSPRYLCFAAAGLLVGLTIIYFWPELASWWPQELPRIYTMVHFLVGVGQTDINTLPLAVYGQLLLGGFVLAFLHPGYSKIPLVAWMLHNQPTRRQLFDWMVRSWILQCGFFVIVFWRIGFMGDLSHQVMLRFVGIFNYICYFATLVLGVLLVRDGLRMVKAPDYPGSNIHLPLIFALSFYMPPQIVWLLLGAREYDLVLTGWLLFVPVMIGVLMARLLTGGIACLIAQWIGKEGWQKWRGCFALFNGMLVLSIVTNTIIRILRSLLA